MEKRVSANAELPAMSMKAINLDFMVLPLSARIHARLSPTRKPRKISYLRSRQCPGVAVYHHRSG
jgi:hypothetical protein